MTCVHRLETSAVEALEREARESLEFRALVFCGVSPGSVVSSDLRRGGLRLNFGAQWIKKISLEMMRKGPMGFEKREDAIRWCKAQNELGMPVRYLEEKLKDDGRFRKICYLRNRSSNEIQDINSEEDVVKTFRNLTENKELFQELFLSPRHTVSQDDPGPLHDLVARFKSQGGRIKSYRPAQNFQIQG